MLILFMLPKGINHWNMHGDDAHVASSPFFFGGGLASQEFLLSCVYSRWSFSVSFAVGLSSGWNNPWVMSRAAGTAMTSR